MFGALNSPFFPWEFCISSVSDIAYIVLGSTYKNWFRLTPYLLYWPLKIFLNVKFLFCLKVVFVWILKFFEALSLTAFTILSNNTDSI